ncbi:MAG: hypothetical protein LH660_02125 [Phormidesmis sp. CAN_BIN36]|nr:hypothetical protein [Phormidesmis sp. CAN_BIN36]
MLERLLQAAAITLLLSLLAGVSSPRLGANPGMSGFHAFSLPVVNPQLHAAFVQVSEAD